ncbi:MAG: hypothetical protein ACOCZ9_00250 [Spirochaetota bacterium]
MGDDREITRLVEESKMVFLREAMEDYRSKQTEYDLEAEFAKTRRNRTLVVPLVIISMVLVFAVAGVATAVYTDRGIETVELDVEEFEDVTLRDVLDSWLLVERRIEDIETRIGVLENERDIALRMVERSLERSIDLVNARDIGEDELENRVAEVESEHEQELSAIRDEYQDQIGELEDELSELERRREEEFDEDEVEAALDRQDLVDDQERLFELEKERLEEFYQERISELRSAYDQDLENHDEFSADLREALVERYEQEIADLEDAHEEEIEELILKYNPELSEGDIAALLDEDVPETGELLGHGELFGDTGAVSEGELEDLRGELSSLSEILGWLRDIPFENSVPNALEHLDARSDAVANEYERMLVALTDSYDALEEERIAIENELRERLEEREAELLDRIEQVEREAEEELAALTDRYEALEEEKTAVEEELRGRLEQREEEMSERIAEVESEYEEELAANSEAVDSYEYALETLLTDDSESGFVIDARSSSEIRVALNPIQDVEEGMDAIVFREPDMFIADIEFYEQDGRLWAEETNVADGRSIRPFDRILVRVPGSELDEDQISLETDSEDAAEDGPTEPEGEAGNE